MRVAQADMVAQPDPLAAPEPDMLYQVSLPGGMEADVYTDATGRVRYVETVPGIAMPDVAHVLNPALTVAAAGATYVVHPAADGRFAVVLRFDEQARLVEVVADPLPPVGSYGTGGHPLMSLLAGGSDRVSPAALLQSLEGSVGESLGRLGAWLGEAVGQGQHVQVRLQVFYDGAGAVPEGVRADWSVDGQAASESFANA
jgi:hypothetical protein